MRFLVLKLRQVRRLGALAGVFIIAGLDFLFRVGRNASRKERSAWLQRNAALMLRAVGFRVTVRGEVPSGGFIAPNHLSYMDIIVLASVAPQVFLSKVEVDSWPVVGAYCRMAGTLYIDRRRRSDVATKEAAFAEVIASGLNMTFFLEGTSTDGRAVLPFRASLLQPLVANGWPITPAYLKYECEEGDVAQDVCWWGDMGFAEHLLRMSKVKRVEASVVFGQQRQPGEDRKLLANELYQDVLALSESGARL
ncbi:lysophospholipid acyltransferase family protein [Pelagicoccus sp. SDUM812005]|uniref:lysophospholipid acyltransferase family protein n=1 Tax=Pelagicoccus sp. SDUM812005 TaxID=3041257 RepID=UPI00280DAD9C|nr:lysophospholipid acyltransferase family protein [Pelagicoccus sp. SDUM812005]MDQ8182083.1 lysophospholipid acyltransferase family protein [Pelagicoccus sp. SDUM812005]